MSPSGGLVQGDVDFILNTGDLNSHSLALKSAADAITYRDQVNIFSFLKLFTLLQILNGISTAFQNAFNSTGNKWAGSPIISLGNNDLYPKYAAPGATPDWFSGYYSLNDIIII